MTEKITLTAFNPAIYHRCLGPMYFEPYARDLAARLSVGPGASVLETAAGTGIVSRHLLDRLPADARLTITDSNEAMLALARQHVGDAPRASWQLADACALPFADGEFDAVVCQFGLMFFPDKPLALREARRVLKRSGALLLNTWASLEENPVAGLAHETLGSLYSADPPKFLTVPFGLYDRAQVEGMLADAGFRDVACRAVDITGESDSAETAAHGIVFGTPLIAGITERGTVEAATIAAAIAARLAAAGGARPMRLPMRALVFTARS